MRLIAVLILLSCAPFAVTADVSGDSLPLTDEALLARWRLDHLTPSEQAQVLGLLRRVAADAERRAGGDSVAEAAQAYLASQGYQPLRVRMRSVDGVQRLIVDTAAGPVGTDAPLGLSLTDDRYLCLPDRAGGIEQLIDARGVVHRLVAAQWTPAPAAPGGP